MICLHRSQLVKRAFDDVARKVGPIFRVYSQRNLARVVRVRLVIQKALEFWQHATHTVIPARHRLANTKFDAATRIIWLVLAVRHDQHRPSGAQRLACCSDSRLVNNHARTRHYQAKRRVIKNSDSIREVAADV